MNEWMNKWMKGENASKGWMNKRENVSKGWKDEPVKEGWKDEWMNKNTSNERLQTQYHLKALSNYLTLI